jgi:hypothetical protein
MNIICSLFPIPCGRGLETIVDNSDFQPRINEAPKEKLDKIGQPSLVLGLELLIFRSWQAKRATY